MIIFVDNNKVSNFFNSNLIQEANFEHDTLCFEEAKEALNYLTPLQAVTTAPIYVFIKMDMPGLNAWEFIEKCQTLAGNKEYLRIVLMLKQELDVEEEIKVNDYDHVTTVLSYELDAEFISTLLLEPTASM